MQKLYWTRGLPGSGKTTRARELCAQVHAQNDLMFRVNRDDLRKEQPGWVRGKFNKNIEKRVIELRDIHMTEALELGHSCISDDTNLTETLKNHWELMGKKYNVEVVCIDFLDPNSPDYISVDDCIKRDLLRNDSVGKDVILKMWYENVVSKVPKPVYDPKKMNAWIVDIDGTLAHHEGLRGVFEENYEVDAVDPAVLAVLQALLATNNILILSGRQGTVKAIEQTGRWLYVHNVPCHRLFMRAEGDARKDSIIKAEIYRDHIEPYYNVVGVLDDRPAVCRMWELMGLKVLRCGPGYEF